MREPIFLQLTPMKTTQLIPSVLVAAVLALGTACSSTNTDATSSTSGNTNTGTGENTSTDGTSGSGAAGSSASSNTGGASGATEPGVSGNAFGDAANNRGAVSDAAGTAADATAFMATFATMEDPAFLLSAASSNLLEIQTGKLAQQQASNAEVKNFGQMMVSHHTQATQELQKVATPLGVKMPTTMMPVHQAMADRLMNKTGKDFDETYMDLMETAHKMDIAMFEAKSKSAKDATVKAFATRTLPMLHSHESMADKLEKKVD
jgi:putative membrane protein